MDPRQERELIGQLAGYTSSILKQIDAGWQDRPGRNQANKLDPKRILAHQIDPAIQVVNEKTIKQIVPNAPNIQQRPENIEHFQQSNQPVTPKKDSNQLEFDMPGVTVEKPNYGPLEGFVKHFDNRVDKLEHELIIMKNMLKDIKENTKKRKYTKKSKTKEPEKATTNKFSGPSSIDPFDLQRREMNLINE